MSSAQKRKQRNPQAAGMKGDDATKERYRKPSPKLAAISGGIADEFDSSKTESSA